MQNSKLKLRPRKSASAAPRGFGLPRRPATWGVLALYVVAFGICNCPGQLTTTPFIRQILTNATAGQVRTNLGITMSDGSFTNANTLFVRKDGTDGAAMVGRIDKPWASISNALVAAPNNHQVLIGPGDYTNHKGMVAHQTGGRATFMLVNLTNVHVRGSGSGTKIQFTNAGTCFFVSNCYNVKITDLTIFGVPPLATGFDAGLTNVHAVIEVEGSANCVFENLHIENHFDQGIYSYQKGGAARSSNCVVRNCTFINLGSWVIDSIQGGVPRYDGAAVVPGSGWTVQDCEIYSCARGIEPFAEYGRHDPCRIVGNKIFNSMDEAIAFGGNALSAGASYGWWTGGEISGNYILQQPGYSRLGSNPVVTHAAIELHSASNVVIKGNYIEGGAGGITVSGSYGSNVVNAIVENNYVKRSSAHGIQFFPINFSSVMNSTIRGNYVSDSQISAIKVAGTNNVVSKNIVDRWNLRHTDGQPAIYVFNPDNGDTSTDTANAILKDNIIWDDVVFAGDSGILLDAGVLNIRCAGNIVQPTNITALVNNAGTQMHYSDYVFTRGGTNVLVDQNPVLYSSDGVSYMPQPLVNFGTVYANYLVSSNAAYLGNLYAGPLSGGPTYASLVHTNQTGAPSSFSILISPAGLLQINAPVDTDMLFRRGANAASAGIDVMRVSTNGLSIDSTDGTSTTVKLHVGGNARVTGTNTVGYLRVTNNPTAGHVLTSDSLGNADWIAPTGGTGSGETNTLSSLGTSNTTVKPVATTKVGVDLRTFSLEAGTNVSLGMTATTIVVNATGGSGAVAGPLASVQYNSNGVQSGSSDLVFTNTNLGLGTTAPASKLHVSDGGSVPAILSETVGVFNNTATSGKNSYIAILAGADGHAEVNFGDTASQTNGRIFYDNFSDELSTHVNGDLAMMINNARQVGFGTATPTARLHVVNNTATNVPLLAVGAAGQSTNLFEVQTSAGAIVYYIDAAGEVIQSGSSVAGRTKYYGTNGNYVEVGAHKDNGSNSVFLSPTNGMAGNSVGVMVYTNTSGIENQGTIVPLGKYTVNSVTNVNSGANAILGDVTSITLTPGDWDVSGLLDVVASGATFTSTSFYMAISPVVGNDFTGQSVGDNASQLNAVVPTTFVSVTLSLPAIRVSSATNITVYLKGYVAAFTAGQPVVSARISARQWR